MRHFDVAPERRQRRPKLMRKGRAELTHLADGVLEPFERVVERGGHIIQFVVCAADGHTAAKVLDVDRACRFGQSRERRQREARHPASDHERGDQSRRHAGDEQKEKPLQRAIHRRERYAHLQQVVPAVGRGQHAVREAQPSVVGVHVQWEPLIAKLAHFGWSELEPERSERIRLDKEPTRCSHRTPGSSVSLHRQTRLQPDPRVEDHRRRLLSEPQVPVEPGGELRKICGDVGIELVRQYPVRHHARRDQQYAEHGRIDEGQPRTEGECHGGTSVSM